MIALGNRRLWLCGEPVDMRKGIDGLVAVVVQRLQREVMTGYVFVFVGRDPSRLTMLCWDHDGYWLAVRRLAAGRFILKNAFRELEEVEVRGGISTGFDSRDDYF